MRHRALCHCTFMSFAVFNMFHVTVQLTNSILVIYTVLLNNNCFTNYMRLSKSSIVQIIPDFTPTVHFRIFHLRT